MPAEEPRPISPLMIEWRGDHFERTVEPLLGNGSEANQAPANHAQVKSAINSRVAKAANDEPVTLVYRDGHREQVRDYSIIGGRLYTSLDYVQSGSWMKTINLSILNLPATIEANQKAGVAFLLPTAANVVVTRF
jgi:hypothetical protein